MKKLSRRTLLRSAGGAALALPLLDAMVSSRGVAQDEIPKRVVFFFTGNGPDVDRWWPSGGETDFTLGPSMEPLAPYRSKLLIPRGISMTTAREARGDGGNGHDVGVGHCLTARGIVAGPSGVGEFGHLWDGTAGGISIDQHIASAVQGDLPYGAISLGARAEGIRQSLPSRISYRGQGQPVTPFHTPEAAWDQIFAGLGTVESGPNPDARRREVVLGAVSADLARLGGRLGRADRQRLQLHAQRVSDIAGRIDASSRVLCEAPGRATAADYGETIDLQASIVTEAFKCNLARVASIQCSTGQSGVRHSWLGHTESHHGISHKGDSDSAARAQSAAIDRWYCERFAGLVGQLDDVDLPDGSTLLDHTTVVWVAEQAKGTGNTHNWNEMPYVLAGGGSGYFKQGVVDTGGRAHGELLVNLMNMMGVPGDSFGNAEYCDGAIDSLIA
ncbi:MAG: hypothetical protein ACI9KE_005708 [Polyangiales bacterium]|jgi:hypothetical protein